MSTTIQYKNVWGEILTSEQVLTIQDYYRKEFYEDSDLKKVEYYYTSEKKLNGLEYYLGAGEDLTTVVSSNIETYGNGTFYYNKQITPGYTSWDHYSYNGDDLIGKGKIVYDNKFREIAYQDTDVLTNEITRTIKKFYLEDLGDYADDDSPMQKGMFEFHYNFDDLGPDEIYVDINLSPFVDSGGYIIDSSKNILTHPLITPIFTWDDHPYYHAQDPLVPTTVV